MRGKYSHDHRIVQAMSFAHRLFCLNILQNAAFMRINVSSCTTAPSA